jgi:hypothetical protein
MATIMNKKPKREIIGANVILLKLKISGLNIISVEEPVIRKKPITTIAKPIAIRK